MKQQLEIPSARDRTAPVKASGTVRKRQPVGPIHLVQNHTCWVTLLQPDRQKKKKTKRTGQDGNTDSFTVVTGTGRRKGRKGTGKEGNADRYTVVTGTERRRGRKSIGQDGNTNRYTLATGNGRRKDGKAQDKMETQTGLQ